MTKEKQFRRVHLYVKAWDWGQVYLTETMNGHPRVGMVYRGLHNPNTGAYLIFVDKNDNPLLLDKLVLNEGKCEMIELNKKNFITITPKEEFLDTMIRWFAEDERRAAAPVTPVQTAPPEVRAAIQKAVVSVDQAEVAAIQEFSKVLASIFTTNRDLFEVLKQVAECAHEVDMDMSTIRQTMTYGPEGKGLNVLEAQEFLEDYLHPIDGDLGKIMAATVTTIQEMVRRKVLGLDEEPPATGPMICDCPDCNPGLYE